MSEYLILSHFHMIIGPRPLLVLPSKVNTIIDIETQNKVARQLDFIQERQFFIQSMENYEIANFYFEIPSQWSRGNKEMLLLSFLKQQESRNLSSMLEPLMNLSKEILKINNVYKAFYFDDSSKKDENKYLAYQSVNVACKQFLQDLPEVSTISSTINKKIFFWGLAKAGKSSLIERMKYDIFNPDITPSITQNVVKFVFSNLNLLCYDLQGNNKFRNLWTKFVNNSALLVFVVDSSEFKLEESKEALFLIINANDPSIAHVPLLVLANKQDILNSQKPIEISSLLELEKIKDRKILGIYGCSAKTGEGLSHVLEIITNTVLKE